MAKTLKLIKLSIYEDVEQVPKPLLRTSNSIGNRDGKDFVMRKIEGVHIPLRIVEQRLTTVKNC